MASVGERERGGGGAAGKGEWLVSVLRSLFLDERLQKPCEHPNNMIIIIGLPTTKPLASGEDKEEEGEQEREKKEEQGEGDKQSRAACVRICISSMIVLGINGNL